MPIIVFFTLVFRTITSFFMAPWWHVLSLAWALLNDLPIKISMVRFAVSLASNPKYHKWIWQQCLYQCSKNNSRFFISIHSPIYLPLLCFPWHSANYFSLWTAHYLFGVNSVLYINSVPEQGANLVIIQRLAPYWNTTITGKYFAFCTKLCADHAPPELRRRKTISE